MRENIRVLGVEILDQEDVVVTQQMMVISVIDVCNIMSNVMNYTTVSSIIVAYNAFESCQ